MLELSKTTYQADIDAACETLDFIRANVKNMLDMYDVQPDLARRVNGTPPSTARWRVSSSPSPRSTSPA